MQKSRFRSAIKRSIGYLVFALIAIIVSYFALPKTGNFLEYIVAFIALVGW